MTLPSVLEVEDNTDELPWVQGEEGTVWQKPTGVAREEGTARLTLPRGPRRGEESTGDTTQYPVTGGDIVDDTAWCLRNGGDSMADTVWCLGEGGQHGYHCPVFPEKRGQRLTLSGVLGEEGTALRY